MTNFIFKSQGTYKKLCQQLDMVLAELRHNRQDMVITHHMLNKLMNNQNLQKQVDEYFEDDAEDKAEHIPDSGN